jgi:hypothetical protein
MPMPTSGDRTKGGGDFGARGNKRRKVAGNVAAESAKAIRIQANCRQNEGSEAALQ